MYLMGIDRGSTNIKAAIYDFSGVEVARESSTLPAPCARQAGWAEQDMETLWETAVLTIRQVLQKSRIPSSKISAIGFSGHGGGLYAIDRTGAPVRPAILSTDSRVYQEDLLRKKAGLPVIETSKADPAKFLAWIYNHEPEVYQKIDKIMAAKDYLRYRMTGVVAVSCSDFGMSSFFDAAGNYAEDAFLRFGLPETPDILPPIHEAWDVCGKVTEQAAKETGLFLGTPCVMGGHDCAVASFGVGGVCTGHLTAIFGTFAMNMLIGTSDFFADLPDDAFGMYDPSVLPQKWLYMNSALIGRGLDWFIKTFCQYEAMAAQQAGDSVYEYLEALAEKGVQSSVICHPYLIPGWKDLKCAKMGIYGADISTTKEDLLFSVFEGLAFAEVQALQPLTQIVPVEKIVLTGGGANNRFWGQILADLLDLPVIVPDIGDAACRGAALLAAIGTGILAGHREAAALPVAVRTQYLPGSARQALYQKNYKKYLELIQYNLPFWKSLENG